jgi:hypothetical protein
MEIDKPKITFFKYKENSRQLTCRKTLIILHPTTLHDGQTVVVAFEQKTNYDKIIFKINRKWANQIHSKKGIGSWLNLTGFMKKSLMQIDLDDLQSILLKRMPIKKYAQQKSKNLLGLSLLMKERQFMYLHAKQTFSLLEEKNQVVMRLLIQIIRDHSILIRNKTKGYQVRILKEESKSMKETLNKLHNLKELKRKISKDLIIGLSPDHLSHMIHLRQQIELQERPYGSINDKDETLRSLYDWTTIFMPEKNDQANQTRASRRHGRRNDFHPVVTVSNIPVLDAIAEATDAVLGKL